ncbi:hypothetical protein RB195_020458 [Necator americanus]|uniref:S1 motif domain-containing protein n=1 Tax=Necator americanus TaxID=51031 RepID=A0ABR1CJV3_NECAM
MSQSRALGEGRIYGIVKKHAYIKDARLGNVLFPVAAAAITSECSDLREKFSADEEVIFTAQKQSQVENDCQYVASSVVKKRELIAVSGKITEASDKFCYAEIKKYGRVFVPYSARNGYNKSWLGKGAEVGKVIQLKIFRQPDINNCRYVAWSINMSTVDDKKTSDKFPEMANGQIGVIVVCPREGDLTVYSAQSGIARLPASLRKSWMSLGTFVNYDVIRQDTDSRAVWVVRRVDNLGLLYEVIDYPMDSSKLLLSLHAVVNRVSLDARNAWLWNDIIGRIFVPAQQFIHGLRAMTCVKIIVVWTGAFEDVPWSATHVEVHGDDAEIRVQNASLLRTDDNWTVSNYTPNQSSFHAFMKHPSYGCAFIAWTDLTEGDTPPRPDTKCRATVFFQSRNGKHPWRAVLVTPLGSDGQPIYHHPLCSHSGLLSLPKKPFKLPPPVLPPVTPIECPKTPTQSFVNAVKEQDPLQLRDFAPSTEIPSPLTNGTPLVSPANHVLSSDSSDGYPDQNTLDEVNSFKSTLLPWGNEDFLKWAPMSMYAPSSITAVDSSPLLPLSFAAEDVPLRSPLGLTSNDVTRLTINDIASLSTNDVATQTEVLPEQQVLWDIINNKELLIQVMKCFPQHCTSIMHIRWQSIGTTELQ